MKNIIISSSNKHKISEIITTIKPLFDKIYSLSDFPDIGDIKEDGTSIVENSFIKSRVAFNHTKLPSMADDTVLEVDHLMGDPGIYTARYAGENATYEENMEKLLKNLKGVPWKERTARFKTVVTYVDGENDLVEHMQNHQAYETQSTIHFGSNTPRYIYQIRGVPADVDFYDKFSRICKYLDQVYPEKYTLGYTL